MRNLMAMLLVAFVINPIAAAAPVPAFIPVQGYLTDDQDQPINQQVSLTISLYDALDASQALFTETTSVQVDQGYFAVHLGGETSLDMNLFRDNTEMYVGISVDSGAELSPRFKLGSVPYAASAASAQSVNWSQIQDIPQEISDGDADTLSGMSCSAGQVASYNGTIWECANVGTDTLAGLDCTDGQVAKYQSSAWECAEDNNTGSETYTAGTGLDLSGTEFSVDQSAIEGMAQGVCYDNPSELASALSAWDQDASDDLTSLTEGAGITISGSGNSRTIAISSGVNLTVSDITYASPQVRNYSVNFREWVVHNAFLSQYFGLIYGNPEDDGLPPNIAALRFSGQGAAESLHAYASFHLPHQATITGLACVVADTHTNGHIAVKIKRTDGITESNLAVAATTDSQTSNDTIDISDDSISNATIDNISYSYILEAGFTVSGDYVIGGATVENQLWMGPCTISYEVSKPLP